MLAFLGILCYTERKENGRERRERKDLYHTC